MNTGRLILAWGTGVIAGAALAIWLEDPDRLSCEDPEVAEDAATWRASNATSSIAGQERPDDPMEGRHIPSPEMPNDRIGIGDDAGPFDLPAPPSELDWFDKDWATLVDEADDETARAQALVEGGFSPGRATWIVSREAELQMLALGDSAPRGDGAWAIDYLDTRLAARQALREEIGDSAYERYLDATGQSTDVGVARVNPESPAQYAGMMPGDRIVGYDGARVFNAIELTELASGGHPGELVLIDILRDGAPMQLVVPRGPLGIAGGW